MDIVVYLDQKGEYRLLPPETQPDSVWSRVGVMSPHFTVVSNVDIMSGQVVEVGQAGETNTTRQP